MSEILKVDDNSYENGLNEDNDELLLLDKGDDIYGVTVIHSCRINNSVVVIGQGSVLDFNGEAIVNAANEGCLGGGGVDGAITSKGGRELAKARQELPVLDNKQTRCKTGNAVITVGGDCNVDWIIHAVGPNYRVRSSISECDDLLISAYKSTMVIAAEKKIKTLAFSLLSAGIFKGPQSLREVLRIAVMTISDNVYPELEYVVLCGFTKEECDELEFSLNTLIDSLKI